MPIAGCRKLELTKESKLSFKNDVVYLQTSKILLIVYEWSVVGDLRFALSINRNCGFKKITAARE